MDKQTAINIWYVVFAVLAAALLLERETLVEAELRGVAGQLAPAVSDQDAKGA